jgi:UDP-glucose 4-epimerase
VVQLAAAIRVEESVADPVKYYANNTVKSLTLFDTCAKAGVKDFVFSSTAMVYAGDADTLLTETTETGPTNPYARSKLASEFMLRDVAGVSGMRSTILRYFNVAGADVQLRTGQRSPEATHLIKVASQVAINARPHLAIFGTDYNTRDGTAIRDYIHVMDLADAHLLALTKPGAAGETRLFNCGYGAGQTVREVVAAFGEVLNHPLPTVERPRRAGDVAILACDPAKVKRELSWAPRYAFIETIVETALNWERKLASGRLEATRRLASPARPCSHPNVRARPSRGAQARGRPGRVRPQSAGAICRRRPPEAAHVAQGSGVSFAVPLRCAASLAAGR